MVTRIQKTLFTPVRIGPITLKHRVVMPPLSRLRAHPLTGVPGDLMVEYYGQRASDGGLIITEATAVSHSGRGNTGTPAIFSEEHAVGWKRVTDAVHAKGGSMFAQLFHAGRTGHIAVTGVEPVSASVIPAYWADPNIHVMTPHGFSQPSPHRALETAEVIEIVEQHRAAAVLAQRAGFDGVEAMADNGQLVDQFLQDGSNNRADHYGGTIENRTRLLLEVIEALISIWGPDRVGARISPSGTYNGMADTDPRRLFHYVTERLNEYRLAYLHIIEPRVMGSDTVEEGQSPVATQELRKVFRGPIISAGGFNPETAEAAVANGDADLVAFGRRFISNPDLPQRIERGLALAPYDRSTFYAFTAHGYTDYPTYGG